MKILLDTHTFIWLAKDDPQLSARVRSAVEDLDNEVFISIVNCWEIQIKTQLGKLTLKQPLEKMVEFYTTFQQVELIEVRWLHVLEHSKLPAIHRDPWDRMLMAQCLKEGFVFATSDSINQTYPVPWVW